MVASCAAHANLVVNGDFESGDLSGWSMVGLGGVVGVTSADKWEGQFGTGFSAALPRGIEQLLHTDAGASYAVEFWLRHAGPADNFFSFNWDGGLVEHSLANINPGYATFTFQLQATSDLTPITFLFATNDGRWSLDSVRVERRDTPGELPEPGTVILLAISGIALRLTRRMPAGDIGQLTPAAGSRHACGRSFLLLAHQTLEWVHLRGHRSRPPQWKYTATLK